MVVFMHASSLGGKCPGLTTSNWTVIRFYSFSEFLTYKVRRSKAMMNRFIKNETVRKFWLTEITTPDSIPIALRICCLEETDQNFRNVCIGIMANIRGLHVLMYCSMASQVMESFLSFFQFYELSMLLNYQVYFSTVAASKVNGVS